MEMYLQMVLRRVCRTEWENEGVSRCDWECVGSHHMWVKWKVESISGTARTNKGRCAWRKLEPILDPCHDVSRCRGSTAFQSRMWFA